MTNKLSISAAVLAAAIATTGCEKTPRNTDQTGSPTSQTNEQPKPERTEPQQRSEPSPTQAPREGTQHESTSQAAREPIEQKTEPDETAKERADRAGTEPEGQPGRQQEAQAGQDRNGENSSAVQPAPQNPAAGKSQGATPEPGAAQQNQAQQDQVQQGQAQQHNQSGQNQQARGTVYPIPPQGDFANGPVNLSRDELRQVQMALKEKGFYLGKIDGVMGPATRRALIAFQRQQGLEPTGRIDQPSIAALGIAHGVGSTTTGQSGAGTQQRE